MARMKEVNKERREKGAKKWKKLMIERFREQFGPYSGKVAAYGDGLYRVTLTLSLEQLEDLATSIDSFGER